MAKRKAMTLRLDADKAEELVAVARVEGLPVAEVAREAILAHVERKRKDNQFQAQLRQIIEEDREILERLAAE